MLCALKIRTMLSGLGPELSFESLLHRNSYALFTASNFSYNSKLGSQINISFNLKTYSSSRIFVWVEPLSIGKVGFSDSGFLGVISF